MADDRIKPAVAAALVKDGWTITADPFLVDYEDVQAKIDLAGERMLAAERGVERIAVEIKSFASGSRLRDVRDARGQYDTYRMMLEDVDPERQLTLPPVRSGTSGCSLWPSSAGWWPSGRCRWSSCGRTLRRWCDGSGDDRQTGAARHFHPGRRPDGPVEAGETEPSLILDDEHEQYALIRIGWHKDGRRAFYPVFMARIRDGKVWVEEDNTDLTLAEELVRAGVRREDIVLGSVHPSERQYSDYAAA